MTNNTRKINGVEYLYYLHEDSGCEFLYTLEDVDTNLVKHTIHRINQLMDCKNPSFLLPLKGESILFLLEQALVKHIIQNTNKTAVKEEK
jgi:hypothetical protein